MKATLIIPDHLMHTLKERAARTGKTLSAVVAETLQRGLETGVEPGPVEPLPTHRMGQPKADLVDRESLYRTMEGG